MLKAISTGYLINIDALCESVCEIEPLLTGEDVSEFFEMIGGCTIISIDERAVLSFYETNIKTNCNAYARLALLVARTIIRMFEERLLPVEGLYVINL